MSTFATVVSVRTGRIARHDRPAWDDSRSEWRTAYWKAEAAGPVHIGTLGLDGDEQANKRVHGGPEMAVLMYADEHYAHWRTLAGLERMGPGGFGENLVLRGVTERDVCVGDVLQVGEARLQVSSPRGPCMDIARRWDTPGLLQQVVDLRRTGWYLRVLRAGNVRVGDSVTLAERPHAGWTIDRLLALRYVKPRDVAALGEAARLAAFAPEWRENFAKLAAG
ncbi:MAG: MOSC domain-containing protein [Candidatus Eisenbacteria bacterium]